MTDRPEFATQKEAEAAGYIPAKRGVHKDVSEPGYFGYAFENSSGQRTVTVWFTAERNFANLPTCKAMFPPMPRYRLVIEDNSPDRTMGAWGSLDEAIAVKRAHLAYIKGHDFTYDEQDAIWLDGAGHWQDVFVEDDAGGQSQRGDIADVVGLPPDPDGENNTRAERATAALADYLDQDDPATALGDLLADLMHWGDRVGIDFEEVFARARGHYNAETDDSEDDAE